MRDWEPVLRQVPTYALEVCFTRAVANHEGDRPFGAPDVCKAWRGLPMDEKCTLLAARADGREAGRW